MLTTLRHGPLFGNHYRHKLCKRQSQRGHFSALTVIHDCLVTFHDYSSLPWFAAIPASTVIISILTLPIAIKSRRNQIKITALQPILDAQISRRAGEIRRKSTPVTFSGEMKRESRLLRKRLHRKHKVNLSAILALPALKLPIWLCFSMTLRCMAGTPIPFFDPLELEDSFRWEGVGWMNDLTVPDGELLLPVLFGCLTLINVEVNATTKREGRVRVVVERGMRVVSVLLIPIAAQMPAALCLYWVSSASATLCQNVWLNRRFPTTTATIVESSETFGRLELPGIDDNLETKSTPKS